MRLDWRDRLTQMPDLRLFSNWPQVNIEDIPKDKRSLLFKKQENNNKSTI